MDEYEQQNSLRAHLLEDEDAININNINRNNNSEVSMHKLGHHSTTKIIKVSKEIANIYVW